MIKLHAEGTGVNPQNIVKGTQVPLLISALRKQYPRFEDLVHATDSDVLEIIKRQNNEVLPLLVGNLYPSILESENELIEQELLRRRLGLNLPFLGEGI